MSKCFLLVIVGKKNSIEKRKIARQKAVTMRNKIYGPIFSWLTELKDRVETLDTQTYTYEEEKIISHIMAHFLFSTVNDDVRKKISDIVSRAEKYENFRHAAELKIKEVTRRKIIHIHKIDTGNDPGVSMRIGRVHVDWMRFPVMLLQGITPEAFVEKAKKKWGKTVYPEARMGGTNPDLEVIGKLYREVLIEVEKDSHYSDEREQRKMLIEEIKTTLDELRPFVEIE